MPDPLIIKTFQAVPRMPADWLRPGTQLRLKRGLLTWTVLMRDAGGVWLKTPFSSTPVELLPIQDVHGWVQDGTMEVRERA